MEEGIKEIEEYLKTADLSDDDRSRFDWLVFNLKDHIEQVKRKDKQITEIIDIVKGFQAK